MLMMLRPMLLRGHSLMLDCDLEYQHRQVYAAPLVAYVHALLNPSATNNGLHRSKHGLCRKAQHPHSRSNPVHGPLGARLGRSGNDQSAN